MRYRRADVAGATYFFTLNAADRSRSTLTDHVDADFAIMLIKQRFSRQVPKGERIGSSRASRGERGVWQRRYWEHLIRDDDDLRAHVEYIHFNPVKHGYARRAGDWPHSSIHRFIERGQVHPDWGSAVESTGLFGE